MPRHTPASPRRPSKPHSTVSLQGEGEPSLHPRFWDMVKYVRQKNHEPYTIINASRVDAVRFARSFKHVGVSIDTLDAIEAETIGRHNLPKVMRNLEDLCKAMEPKRIVIMTVDMGQPLAKLKSWVQQRGFASHVVQPLMQKTDYAQRYPQHRPQPQKALPKQPATQPLTWHSKTSLSGLAEPQSCRFLHQDQLRYYTWQGLALPCCFIKDTQGIESIEALRTLLARGHVPGGCAGCRELKPVPIKQHDHHITHKQEEK